MKKDIKININYKKIGQRIRKRRLEVGLTQEQASEKVGITTKYWSNIETNNTAICRTANLICDSSSS